MRCVCLTEENDASSSISGVGYKPVAGSIMHSKKGEETDDGTLPASSPRFSSSTIFLFPSPFPVLTYLDYAHLPSLTFIPQLPSRPFPPYHPRPDVSKHGSRKP